MGWLHSSPKSKIKDQPSISRIKSLSEDDPLCELPEVNDCADIITAFRLCGRMASSGMGAIPLSWTEIDSFCRRSGIDLDGWGCQQLRTMSEEYCHYLIKGAEDGCQPPLSRELTEDELKAKAKRAQDEFDRFADLHNASLQQKNKTLQPR